jgi:hypothetical protein
MRRLAEFIALTITLVRYSELIALILVVAAVACLAVALDYALFGWLSPEVSESVARQLGIANCVLDVPVAEIGLQRAGVVAIIGQLEAAGVPQHVRMDRKGHLCGLAEPCYEVMEAERASWARRGSEMNT